MRVKKRDAGLHPDPDQSELRLRLRAAGPRPAAVAAAAAASGSDQSTDPREHLSSGTRLGSQGAAGRQFFSEKNIQKE